jgi:hypothetical protein
MSSSTIARTADRTTTTSTRPGRGRRVAVGASAFLAGVLPVVWGVASAVQLATGTEADHRFHQVTGQGLLMCALWLWPVLALARAGMRGRRPATQVALLHLAVAVAAVVPGALAPEGGGGFVAVVIAVTGALLWAALPVRPHLGGVRLDVVHAPLALLAGALATPFVVGELDLQRAMSNEHAEMAHYFDMAFVSLTLVGMLAAAALSPAGRRLALPAGAGLVLTGASRWVFTGETTWSLLAVLLGAACALAGARRSAA